MLRSPVAFALLCAGCSGGDDSPGATTPAQGGNAGSSQLSGSGGAGRGGGMGGSVQPSAGTSASGSGGALPSGGAGGAGRAAAGASGAAGAAGTAGAETSNPCVGLPAGCFALCEGGMCQCECPDAEPCPASEPAQDAACNTVQLCGYGEPACHRIFECFTGVWKKVADTCADGPNGSCPPTLGEAMSTPCIDRRCGYDGQICQCGQATCSGAFMEPSTYCIGVTPAACLPAPVAGADCLPEGQRCGATCCGLQFTCTGGKWSSMFIQCPP